jgi:hypothetical protein
MRSTIRDSLCLALLAASLCACNSTALTTAFNHPALDPVMTSVSRTPVFAHRDHGKSWTSSELARIKVPVLFVSDAGTADVYIYNLSTLKVMGTITGFSQPQGECSDNKGNVWVADSDARVIYELSHRGLLQNELSDTTGYPVACAWDRSTGNLAVMNLFNIGSVGGDVLIYTKGSQYSNSYVNPAQYYYNFGSYDAAGNLFFDGRDAQGSFMLSELPKGAQKALTVKLSGGTIYFPGMVQWNSAKTDLIVGDQSCGGTYVSCLYAVNISGNSGKIMGQVNLQNYSGGHVCDLVQGVEYNSQIFGSDYNFCGYAKSATYVWPYPGGGAPAHYNDTTDSTPIGAAISP